MFRPGSGGGSPVIFSSFCHSHFPSWHSSFCSPILFSGFSSYLISPSSVRSLHYQHSSSVWLSPHSHDDFPSLLPYVQYLAAFFWGCPTPNLWEKFDRLAFSVCFCFAFCWAVHLTVGFVLSISSRPVLSALAQAGKPLSEQEVVPIT